MLKACSTGDAIFRHDKFQFILFASFTFIATICSTLVKRLPFRVKTSLSLTPIVTISSPQSVHQTSPSSNPALQPADEADGLLADEQDDRRRPQRGAAVGRADGGAADQRAGPLQGRQGEDPHHHQRPLQR